MVHSCGGVVGHRRGHRSSYHLHRLLVFSSCFCREQIVTGLELTFHIHALVKRNNLSNVPSLLLTGKLSSQILVELETVGECRNGFACG